MRVQLLKFRQYGRAMGAVAGTGKGRDGLVAIAGFCRHMERLTRWSRQAGLPADELRQIRAGTLLAIVETARVYVLSLLLRRRRGVGCAGCARRPAAAPGARSSQRVTPDSMLAAAELTVQARDGS
jgi:hypothetical protein